MHLLTGNNNRLASEDCFFLLLRIMSLDFYQSGCTISDDITIKLELKLFPVCLQGTFQLHYKGTNSETMLGK